MARLELTYGQHLAFDPTHLVDQVRFCYPCRPSQPVEGSTAFEKGGQRGLSMTTLMADALAASEAPVDA